MEIQEAREEPENEANFSQADVLLQLSADVTLVLLSESDTIMNGSMRQIKNTVWYGSCRP